MHNADTTAIHHHQSGAVSLTGDAVHLYRVLMIQSGLKLLLKTNGRMRLTRTANPKTLLSLTTEITGKKFPNSQPGWASAITELQARIDALRASIPVIIDQPRT